MLKQEKIKEAWGDYYEKVKNDIDENGKLSYDNCWKIFGVIDFYNNSDILDLLENDYDGNYFIKSLKEIENNNGWINIESEGDLPKDRNVYYLYCLNGKYNTNYICKLRHLETMILEYGKALSHYRPIEKIKPPIY